MEQNEVFRRLVQECQNVGVQLIKAETNFEQPKAVVMAYRDDGPFPDWPYVVWSTFDAQQRVLASGHYDLDRKRAVEVFEQATQFYN